MMRMTWRGYTLGLLLLALAALAAAAAFNRVVDPFWYYRDIEIAGFNAVKPRFARFERHVKPALLAREQPQAVIFGSSYAEIGFDPLDAALTDGGKLKGYNFAFAGAAWAHQQCAFEYALRHAPMKRAVLGIHADVHPLADCARVWQGMSVTQAELLLSTTAFDNAVRTVVEQRRARPSHTREGRYWYAREAPGVAARFREHFAHPEYAGARCARERFALPPAVGAQAITPAANLEVSGLRQVLRLARERGVEVVLVVYPRHAMALEIELLCGDATQRWAKIEALARVVADESPGGNAALWVFDDYDAVSGERVLGREPVYWQDPAHFNWEVGTRMLAAIYGGKTGFGERIKPGGASAAYARLLERRAAFLAQTPWFYEDLRALAAPAAASVK